MPSLRDRILSVDLGKIVDKLLAPKGEVSVNQRPVTRSKWEETSVCAVFGTDIVGAARESTRHVTQ